MGHELLDGQVFEGRSSRSLSVLFSILANVIFAAVIIFMLLFVYCIRTYPLCNIKGASMQNSFYGGDSVLISQEDAYSYRDVIVFTKPNAAEGNDPLIKRVIAKAGDVVLFIVIDSQVSLSVKRAGTDGFVLLTENYIKETMLYGSSAWSAINYGGTNRAEYVVSENCYFVMGDNRNNSTDSRVFGEVKSEDIFGKVKFHLKKDSLTQKLLFLFYRNPQTADNG